MLLLGASAGGLTPTTLHGQELLSPQDLMAAPRPEPNQRIAYGGDALQFAELYLPTGPGPHPVLAFIHGGCFLSAFDIAHTAPFARAIADEGIAVWSLEYRRVGDPGGGWPGTFQDVGRGLDHLTEIAPEYGLDLERAVVGGHSAGGTLALWAAGRSQIAEDSELWTAEPAEFDAVFGLAAVGDLEGVQADGVCGNVVDRLMGGAPPEVPERYAAASPMRLVPLKAPVIFAVGALDASWTPPALAWFAHAREAGSPGLRRVDLPESGHFEMIAPTTSTWPLVRDALLRTFRRLNAGR